MKAFAIFPTVCVFAITLSLLTLTGLFRPRITLICSSVITCGFGGLMTLFSMEAFRFLYYANYIGVPISILCFTFLSSRLWVDRSDGTKWVKILGLGLLSSVVTIGIFMVSMFIALASNSMMGPKP
jgi:hypothetical protein